MLSTYAGSAFRHLWRNPFYGGITIAGLTVSFAAVILIVVFVRDELSYDRFIPGHKSVYRLEASLTEPGGRSAKYDMTPASAADQLKLDFAEVQDIVRITPSQSALRRDRVEATDKVFWADESLFLVLPLRTIQGDVAATLAQADGLVLTRSMAYKYFGSDQVVGRPIEINPRLDNLPGLRTEQAKALGSYHIMRVGAVIEDLPTNTHLDAQIFAAAKASFSPMKRWDEVDTAEVYTYLRLKSGTEAATLVAGLQSFGRRHFPRMEGRPQSGWDFRLTPLTDIHLATAGIGAMKPSGDRGIVAAIAAVGLLLAGVAAINFIMLATARSTHRAIEVAVRKTVGARRSELIGQFMSEAIVQVVLAMILAAGLAELVSPYTSAFLQRALQVSYLADPVLLVTLLLTSLIVGTLAGFYPALVLSSFRPAIIVGGGPFHHSGTAWVRQLLVVIQFAVLIGLIVVATTIYRQTTFALKDSLRLDTRQVMTMFAPCTPSFTDELKLISGVHAAACTSSPALDRRPFPLTAEMAGGARSVTQGAPVGPGFLELQGLRPIAGRFFSESLGQDIALMRPGNSAAVQPPVVLNESAVQKLGFRAPQDAIGRTVFWSRRTPEGSSSSPTPMLPSTVIGVVHDYSLGSVRTAIQPTIYYVDPKYLLFVAAKLGPEAGASTLVAIDQLWRRSGHQTPLQRSFEDQVITDLYRDVISQGTVMALCSALAVLVACLGLFALSTFSMERRIKEIGVRKAMGASTTDIVRLMLWHFVKPVLIANLIAWPLAWLSMKHWLDGFAYHVSQPLWVFAGAGSTGVLLALVTVFIQTVRFARSRPVSALRYE